MEQIKPQDWTILAHKWANIYRTQGEYDDLFQQAMLGIVKASQSFKGKCSFQGWASFFIRKELQALLYTDVKSGAKRHRLETPLSPNSEDFSTAIAVPSSVEDELFVSEFLTLLPLEVREKEFFKEILEHGTAVAGVRYQERHGMTRQGMGLQRRKILKVAAEAYNVAIGE